MIYGSIPGAVPFGGFFSQTILTAQSISLIPVASPCYDPCTMNITVTWVNNTSGTLPAGQIIGIKIDGITPQNGSKITLIPIPVGGTITEIFTVTGLTHITPNMVCPVPN